MEPNRDDLDLAAELRALRPTPEPAFAAALDARAAAGFPREGRAGGAIGRFADRLRTAPPRRLLAPASALAVAGIAIATALVTTSDNGQDAVSTGGGGERLSIAPRQPEQAANAAPAPMSSVPSKSASGASETSSSQYEAAVPQAAAPESGPGPYASRTDSRDIERSAQIVLATDPAEVRAGAAKVFDAVHAADGIVLDSSIRDGDAGRTGASFDLLIPSGRLDDALVAFSSIAEVRSRHETTQDITAPTVSVGERLQDTQAKIEGLLAQLAGAETSGERAAVEAQLRAERRRSAFLRARLNTLQRRANFSRVSLRIETGAAATVGADGSWGVSDALGDASRILAVAAGVTVVGLAILVPLALILLLAWLAHHWWLRVSRKRALG